MKAVTLAQTVQEIAARPDARVFVLCQGRYVDVEQVVGTAVDPTITGATSVCIMGTEYVNIATVPVGELIEELSRRGVEVSCGAA